MEQDQAGRQKIIEGIIDVFRSCYICHGIYPLLALTALIK